MKIVFWVAFTGVFYAYFGYAAFLVLYAKFHPRPIAVAPRTPRVSIIMAVCNEESNLVTKLENLRLLDYPSDKLEIVVASDGSTDQTVSILQKHTPAVVPVILDTRQGKAIALNAAVAKATGEILVFLDARQTVEVNAIAELALPFADPNVGAASGELLLEAAAGTTATEALGIYWKIEKFVRKLESATGSVVGATGAIYAVRRSLYTPIPQGTILDDVFVPMHVVLQGKRVVFQSSARAHDKIFANDGKEFARKVRTLAGNYQLIQLAPWILSFRNPLLFRFISHKCMRLIVPALLVVMLVTSAAVPSSLYHSIFFLQVAFYLLAGLGVLIPSCRNWKPVSISRTFVMLNMAAVLAFYNFISGKTAVWNR